MFVVVAVFIYCDVATKNGPGRGNGDALFLRGIVLALCMVLCRTPTGGCPTREEERLLVIIAHFHDVALGVLGHRLKVMVTLGSSQLSQPCRSGGHLRLHASSHMRAKVAKALKWTRGTYFDATASFSPLQLSEIITFKFGATSFRNEKTSSHDSLFS